MAWLFRLLDRTARPLWLALMLVVILGFRAGMQATLVRLREVSGESILDYEIFYSRDRILEILQSYGPEGFKLYQRFMTFDLAFPLLYGVFFASLIHMALSRTRYRLLALTPLAMALFDYVENIFFHAFLSAYPDISQAAVVAANGMTLGKFGFGAASAVSGAVAAFLFIRSRFRRA